MLAATLLLTHTDEGERVGTLSPQLYSLSPSLPPFPHMKQRYLQQRFSFLAPWLTSFLYLLSILFSCDIYSVS